MKRARGKPKSELMKATRVLYDALRAYAATHETDGKPLAPLWERAPDEIVSSVAGNLLVYLANPGAPDHLLHTLATERAMAEGWKFGKVEDARAKLSPMICGFTELPRWMQDMTRITKAVAEALRPTIPQDELKHAIAQAQGASDDSRIVLH